MTSTETNTNTKKNTVKQKFAGMKPNKNWHWNNHDLKVPPEGWDVFYINMEHMYPKKKNEVLIGPKFRWIFAESFSGLEIISEEDNTVILVWIIS